MSDWILEAIKLGFLEPKSCSLNELEPVLVNLETKISYLDPYIAKNLTFFRYPEKTFPTAKYAISLALPYYNTSLEKGGFSLYCQSKDYHFVLRALLNSYLLRLKLLYPGYTFNALFDTGLILDRAVAYASGLGYLGFNTCIIHPTAGSFLFLATVLTDLPLAAGNPLGFCQKCGACINACPTGAIKEPFLLDNRICISAITQTKGYLTCKECEMIKGHLFGCDICQLVCPHNQAISSSSILTPFYLLRKPELLKLIKMEPEYRLVLKQSAAAWRGLNIIRRNALIALTFNNIQVDFNEIKKVAVNDPSHLIRAYGAYCLKKRTEENCWPSALLNAPKEAFSFRDSIKYSG